MEETAFFTQVLGIKRPWFIGKVVLSKEKHSGWTFMLIIRGILLSLVPNVRGCVPYMTI